MDPTLTPALEAIGYDRTRRTPELPLATALEQPRRPRRRAPNPLEPWRQVTIGERTISRPPGLRLDTGGIGKGLAADLLAHRLHGRWAVDCGGDLRVSGRFDVHVRHPLTRRDRARLHASRTAPSPPRASTRRLWRAPDGTPRHHLLDPSTLQPAWTGVISATALAPTAVEAEALAKAALLERPDPTRGAGCAGTAG